MMVAAPVAGQMAGIVVASPAAAQMASSIVVEGNRRVEADTIRSYFKPGPTARSTPAESMTASRL